MGLPMFDRLGAGLKVCVGYRGTRELLFEIGNLFLSREMDHDDHSQEHGHACGGGSCGCSAD
jgi:Nitrogenase molybdenum-iron protein, alpha and beta chains